MQKPEKTFADYVVIAISPLLIMVLVGSLAFFLIEVFYRGETVRGIRWVMFWFVFAIVLVSRVAIEQSAMHAQVYGAALAATMCFYLAYTHKIFILGAILLAITWWCAHKLTTDCTLINDDEDASGEGVLQGLWRRIEQSVAPPTPLPAQPPRSALELLAAAELAERSKRRSSRKPGRWVIYFSLAALPLFGFGQLLLPTDDPAARQAGFAFLAVYLGAALGLLITTSFLSLRRYLRQRSVEMPTNVAVGWIRLGMIIAAVVLVLALLLPRPGAQNSWRKLTHQIERKMHNASEHALPFNPPGEGNGIAAINPPNQNQPAAESRNSPPRNSTSGNTTSDRPNNSNQSADRDQTGQGGGSGRAADSGGSGQSTDRGRSGEANRPANAPQSRDTIPASGDQPNQQQTTGGSDGGGREPQGRDRQPRDGSGAGGESVTDSQSVPPDKSKPSATAREDSREQTQNEPANDPPKVPKPSTPVPYRLLRALLIIALAALFVWWVIRYRQAIGQAIRSFIGAVRQFFRKLFEFLFAFFRRKSTDAAVDVIPPAPILDSFGAYENPFVTGKDRMWPPERLLVYTYAAVQAWSKEQGIELEPQQTPREFCGRLIERFPDFGPELHQFSFLYSHAAFAKQLPEDYESESIRRLWQYLGDSVAVVSTR